MTDNQLTRAEIETKIADLEYAALSARPRNRRFIENRIARLKERLAHLAV